MGVVTMSPGGPVMTHRIIKDLADLRIMKDQLLTPKYCLRTAITDPQLLDNLGLFFQIRDDFANLCSKEYSDAKTFSEDLTEGKFR